MIFIAAAIIAYYFGGTTAAVYVGVAWAGLYLTTFIYSAITSVMAGAREERDQ